jgi:hypothetical protein
MYTRHMRGGAGSVLPRYAAIEDSRSPAGARQSADHHKFGERRASPCLTDSARLTFLRRPRGGVVFLHVEIGDREPNRRSSRVGRGLAEIPVEPGSAGLFLSVQVELDVKGITIKLRTLNGIS